MAVAVGVSLVVLSVVLGFLGFVTLIFGVGILLLLVALVLFILGILEISKGDPPTVPFSGYHAPAPYGTGWYPANYPHPYAPGYGSPMAAPYGPYAPATYLAPVPTVAPGAPAPPPPAERYCSSCGAGNLRASAFCHKCGKPLPPPS